jgi:hypothetical protein
LTGKHLADLGGIEMLFEHPVDRSPSPSPRGPAASDGLPLEILA